MPGVRDYHVLALDRPATDEDLDELVRVGARIACQLGRELRGDAGAFTMIVNGHRASRRPWAHVHIIPVDTPARKRRAFAFLFLKGPLRRLDPAARASARGRRAARPRATAA